MDDNNKQLAESELHLFMHHDYSYNKVQIDPITILSSQGSTQLISVEIARIDYPDAMPWTKIGLATRLPIFCG